MPSYPFIVLALLFLAIVTLPPLVAAILDMRREAREAAREERNP